MSNKKTHGGRREGSGRKRVDFSLIIKVGQAYMRLEQLEYEAQKRALLEDKTNLKEFYDYINDIPLDKRKAFVGSDDHIDHSKAIDRELTDSKIKRPRDSGRLIRVTKSHNSSTRIRNEVAEAFGLSAVQVKNYLQKYRAFLRDNKQSNLKKIRLTEQGFVLPYIVRRNAKRSILMRKTAWQPEQPLPQYADKVTAAAIITHHFFPISPRTLERWPLTVRRPNKATVYEVDELMCYAEERLNSAYAYKQAEG